MLLALPRHGCHVFVCARLETLENRDFLSTAEHTKGCWGALGCDALATMISTGGGGGGLKMQSDDQPPANRLLTELEDREKGTEGLPSPGPACSLTAPAGPHACRAATAGHGGTRKESDSTQSEAISERPAEPQKPGARGHAAPQGGPHAGSLARRGEAEGAADPRSRPTLLRPPRPGQCLPRRPAGGRGPSSRRSRGSPPPRRPPWPWACSSLGTRGEDRRLSHVRRGRPRSSPGRRGLRHV